MEVIFNNHSGAKFDRALIRKLADRVSRKKWKVSISFVSRSAMKELNMKYRKKNRPTDVLSFNMDEGNILGDVVICSSVAKENAKEYGTSLKAEIARLVAHGLLHLLGYDHGKKMFDLQDKILGEVNA